MSSANCAGTIEESVGELDGVSSVGANYATDGGSVEYDPDVVSLADIVAAVEDAGYGVATETVTVGITDMSCANCADANEEALEGTVGRHRRQRELRHRRGPGHLQPGRRVTCGPLQRYRIRRLSPVRPDGESIGDGDDGEQPALTAVPPRATRRRADSSGSRCSERCCRPRSCVHGGPPVLARPRRRDGAGSATGLGAIALATPVQILLGSRSTENSYKALVKNGRRIWTCSSR